MTYDVLSTGSQGNAVVINETILIDCGVPFKTLEPVVPDLKLVLLTHRHSDHFRPRTVAVLHKLRPCLRFGCCAWMVPLLQEAGVRARQIDLYDPGKAYRYPGLCCLLPEALTHNVPNCGYHLRDREGKRLFYATDTETLDGVTAKDYDLYLVEANHTRAELEARLRAKQEAGVYAYEWDVAQNHLSREQAEDWIYQNIGPTGQYAFLHQHVEPRRGVHETESLCL